MGFGFRVGGCVGLFVEEVGRIKTQEKWFRGTHLSMLEQDGKGFAVGV